MRIALDAMGGDKGPGANVAGAIKASRQGFEILLVGDEAVLREEIAEQGGLPPNVHLAHASEVVEMDDKAVSAARRKRDSSLRVSFELVSKGQAEAVVTMGNSGAAMASALFSCGHSPGVLRPAIASIFPGRQGPVVLLDSGASVDCKPEFLLQFGLMGAALVQAAFGERNPKLAVLSNGAEAEKGTDLTRSAAKLLAAAPGLSFAGYIEPHAVLEGNIRVVVTDGWTGNIMIKAAEGMALHIKSLVRDAADRNLISQAGALLLRPSLKSALAELDYSEYGGGLLLGVDAVSIIGHGAAEPNQIANALSFANRVAGARLLNEIRTSLATGQDATDAVEMPERAE